MVRRTPDAGRYVLLDGVTGGPAMFDITRLDQAGGPTRAATGPNTASLDEVLCILASATTSSTKPAAASRNSFAPPRDGTVQIRAGRQALTAAVPLPDDLRDALATIGRAGAHQLGPTRAASIPFVSSAGSD